MEEPQLTTAPEAISEPRSLFSRFTDVFVSPGAVFDEVKNSPTRHVNWILPLVLVMLIGSTFVWVAFSQPAIMEQLRAAQDQKIESMVKQGKLTRQQADQATQAIDKFTGPTMMKLFGTLGVVFGLPAKFFLTGVVLFLLGKFAFRASFDFMKAVEVCGLATLINVVGGIVTTFLVVIFGSLLASPGPILLVRPIDMSNKLHLVLAALNLFTLWYVAVLSIGLAKLAGGTVLKAAIWLYGLWILITFVPMIFQ